MLTPDASLLPVLAELEAHAADAGWDQPAKLFALVPTAELVDAEPALAQALGLDSGAAGLTPIDQELPADTDLESALGSMMWPGDVVGCAAVVERVVLPPSADLPEDREEAVAYAAAHPERQELRMIVAATRDGGTACALRFRSHDDPESVVTGPDLVPALLQLLQATLRPEPNDPSPGSTPASTQEKNR